MADDEGPSLGGRLGRYARVGASVGGLAARLAGERYLGWTLDRDKHAADLKSALGGLKGPLMKAAQLLATIPDALPPEYARELAQLQANAPAMGWAFVKRRMATELGPWRSTICDSRSATSTTSCSLDISSCEPSGRFFRLWSRRSGLEWISGRARPFGHV